MTCLDGLVIVTEHHLARRGPRLDGWASAHQLLVIWQGPCLDVLLSSMISWWRGSCLDGCVIADYFRVARPGRLLDGSVFTLVLLVISHLRRLDGCVIDATLPLVCRSP